MEEEAVAVEEEEMVAEVVAEVEGDAVVPVVEDVMEAVEVDREETAFRAAFST
jgi:hypothetical protein